jgi:hypothetical protein
MNTDKVIHTGTGWSSLERPRFAPGLLLEDEDLNVGVSYTQGLMRLMFKSFFGCGVVCGLDVKVTPTCHDTKRLVEISRGVALDCAGDLIELPAAWKYEFDPTCEDKYPDAIWVVICYTERCCRKKDVACGGDDDSQSQPTRVRSGYEIRLYNDYLPACACRCLTEDDQTDPTKPAGGCCREPKQPAAGQDASMLTKADPCDCYKPHFEGVCECDCACKCVVLAKINKPEQILEVTDTNPSPIEVKTNMVRRVRPLLRGYVDCFVGKKSVDQGEPDAATQVTRAETAMKQAETQMSSRKTDYDVAVKRLDTAKKAVAAAKEKAEAEAKAKGTP